MRFHVQQRAVPALAVLLLIGGCAWNDGPTLDDGTTVGEQFKAKYGWTEERMLRHGWLDARVIAPHPIYCYRTLSTPECYRTPQEGEQNRLIGYFGPPAR